MQRILVMAAAAIMAAVSALAQTSTVLNASR